MARRLAVVVALTAGVMVLIYGLAQAWVPESVARHLEQVCTPPGTICPPTVVGAVTPGHVDLTLFELRYVVLAMAAALVTFLVVALVRVAWRSFK